MAPSSAKSRRAYDSPRRREQAQATRKVILDAARTLFVKDGYVATTIDSIAARADVSPETVYAVFKNKRSVLSVLVDVSIAGDDAPVPILERAWVREIREEQDPRRRLQILARNGTLILERMSPIYTVLQGAGAAEPEIANLLANYNARRFAGQRELLRLVVARGSLREGLSSPAAADIVFAIGSPETFKLLVVDRGWPADRFERWYAETLRRLLLD